MFRFVFFPPEEYIIRGMEFFKVNVIVTSVEEMKFYFYKLGARINNIYKEVYQLSEQNLMSNILW